MNKPPTQRQLRVGETIRHALAEMLARGEVHDPGLEGRVVTVTEVTVTPDLKQATAYVMPLGGDETAGTIEALNRARKYMRGRIGKVLTTRFTPELSFKADNSFDYSSRMDRLFSAPDFHRDTDDGDPPGGES
jgi:ribosome-binding factor A